MFRFLWHRFGRLQIVGADDKIVQIPSQRLCGACKQKSASVLSSADDYKTQELDYKPLRILPSVLSQIPKRLCANPKMLCVNSVQRRFQISDYKFFQSDTAPYESRKHSVAEISQQITTGPKCARTDYKHEGEKSEALEMCIRILLGPQKTCRQITKQEMLCPSMPFMRFVSVRPSPTINRVFAKL